jgi:hypothetical protein
MVLDWGRIIVSSSESTHTLELIQADNQCCELFPRELHQPEREADRSFCLVPTLSTSGAIPPFLKWHFPVGLLIKSIFVYHVSSIPADTVFLMLHLGISFNCSNLPVIFLMWDLRTARGDCEVYCALNIDLRRSVQRYMCFSNPVFPIITIDGISFPDDGDSRNLWNVRTLQQYCTKSQPRMHYYYYYYYYS